MISTVSELSGRITESEGEELVSDILAAFRKLDINCKMCISVDLGFLSGVIGHGGDVDDEDHKHAPGVH